MSGTGSGTADRGQGVGCRIRQMDGINHKVAQSIGVMRIDGDEVCPGVRQRGRFRT